MLITLARKPLEGTVASNVVKHGCGALNVDGCRIAGVVPVVTQGQSQNAGLIYGKDQRHLKESSPHMAGRWPANVLLASTPAVLDHFPEVKGQVGMSKTVGGHRFIAGDTTTVQKFDHDATDTGSAARFFKQVKG